MTVPADFTADSGMPTGIEFLAREYEEELLFELAYAYEQVSPDRSPPEEFGPVEESDAEWSADEIESWNEDQKRDSTADRLGCQ